MGGIFILQQTTCFRDLILHLRVLPIHEAKSEEDLPRIENE
jgi:hypothetical protein